MRVMIGIQLVIAGYQLPAKYQKYRWKEMLLILIPVMTMMWLATTVCILATIPKVTLLAAMVIAACVTSTDPVLSQAVAKGPFADKYVARPVREIISSEAGANDGFGFPFLMLATYLIRHASGVEVEHTGEHERDLEKRAGDVERQGGGAGEAIKNWVIFTLIYYVVLGAVYGAVVGTLSRFGLKYSLKKLVETMDSPNDEKRLTVLAGSGSTARAICSFPWLLEYATPLLCLRFLNTVRLT